MNVNQVLTLAGRLDDRGGFDTPRDRFRRFLSDRITDAQAARLVIEQCLQTAGEQNRRALQDAVVLTGRCLGFRTIFGRYQYDPGSAPVSGEWESRRRLHVVLSICTGETPTFELDALAKVVRHAAGSFESASTPRIGLCVTTPSFPGKARVEEMLRPAGHPELRLISVNGLLHMADMVASRRLTHDDVLQVLNPAVSLDALIDLLDRGTPPPAPAAARQPLPDRQLQDDDSPRGACWVAAIRLDPFTDTSQFVESVIARRQVLPVNLASSIQHRVEAGDSICVCVDGVGLVAHARVSEIVSNGNRPVRQADRFDQVLGLSDVAIYDVPVIPEPDLASRVEEVPLSDEGTAIAIPISRQQFEMVAHAAAAAETR